MRYRLFPYVGLTLLAASLAVLSACGSNDSATVVSNGRQYQLSVAGIQTVAGPPGGAIAGYDGLMTAPLSTTINFNSAGYISDVLVISVSDVGAVYQQLGAWNMIGGGLIDAYLKLEGVPQALYYGQVRFTDISNVTGNRVCAQYQIVTADAQIDGDFCDDVDTGY